MHIFIARHVFLKGGFQQFSAQYHFLRTQKMIYTPRELEQFKTYPIEIIPGLLYMGNEIQGNDKAVQEALKVSTYRVDIELGRLTCITTMPVLSICIQQ